MHELNQGVELEGLGARGSPLDVVFVDVQAGDVAFRETGNFQGWASDAAYADVSVQEFTAEACCCLVPLKDISQQHGFESELTSNVKHVHALLDAHLGGQPVLVASNALWEGLHLAADSEMEGLSPAPLIEVGDEIVVGVDQLSPKGPGVSIPILPSYLTQKMSSGLKVRKEEWREAAHAFILGVSLL